MDNNQKSINELLPLELLQAILVRVPAKHLFPLRFVSKLWLSLISDPTFVEFHFHHTSEFTIPSYFFAHNDQLVGSVDLHALFHGGATLDTSIEKFSLPFPWKKNTRSNLLVLGSCRGTNSWTKIDVAPPTPLITYEFIPWGLFFNGAIHWLSYRPSNRDILIFDVKKRRFSKIPLPEQKLTWWPSKLVILGGCLALNFFDYRDNNKRTQVWVLKKYKVPSSWILLYEIPHHCISLFLSNYSDVIVLDRVTMNFAKYKLEGERVQCFKYFNYSFCHVIAFEHISTVYTPSLATLPSCDKKKWKNVRYWIEFCWRIFSQKISSLSRMIGIQLRHACMLFYFK
ncbi:putative F-box protein [Arachis hypogaea]|nr:putative F-box protein [Arachis hypogaea]